MSVKDGGQAFPSAGEIDRNNDYIRYPENGMTLRDYFAAKAMPAIYAETCRQSTVDGWVQNWKMGVVVEAYKMADAMLKARESV